MVLAGADRAYAQERVRDVVYGRRYFLELAVARGVARAALFASLARERRQPPTINAKPVSATLSSALTPLLAAQAASRLRVAHPVALSGLSPLEPEADAANVLWGLARTSCSNRCRNHPFAPSAFSILCPLAADGLVRSI